jgi:hypothetical protein
MANTAFFRVVTLRLKIRRTPSLAGLVDGTMIEGQVIECDPSSRVEAEGFVWYQHSLGWSAERDLTNGTPPFLMQFTPEAQDARASDVINTNTAPTIMLPSGRTIPRVDLFVKHPILPGNLGWTQCFGNTRFAYNLQFDRDPARQRAYFYCQGLHGGLDYGNNAQALPIVAGLTGTISQVVRMGGAYSPGFVRVRSGDYTVIYGHIGSIPGDLVTGMPVGPDTVMGQIERSQNHLHLEVRYRDTWIINPLVYMPPALSDAFLARAQPPSAAFYNDATWTRWQTPFDQPVLKLDNPARNVIIGPRAARG